METKLPSWLRETAEGAEADRILRKCVHCGFCLATCPTYQLLGDELDSPRGRIYLIKQTLEGSSPTARTRLHLDRCLTCRACETTCPSGVEYGRLLDIGRGVVEQGTRRSPWMRFKRRAVRWLLPKTQLFGVLLRFGRVFKPVLPRAVAASVPPRQKRLPDLPVPAQPTRRMLVLEGCVQPAATPNTNAVARRILAAFGIELIAVAEAGCCGALDYHMAAHE
ncbi:MAG: 4Fe-4S dicluster domain-containing protein, partial [Sinobacteraceae bacterium]|nr:4Fe-4S dicluster domain-containing protein [Nevskiaceae bacterium]